MSEEFDIMKPISLDLDIGTTMFDTPKKEDDRSKTQVSLQQPDDDKNVKADTTPVAEYKKPVRSGVDDVDYGYLTEEEAEFMNSLDERPEEQQKVPPDGPVAAPEMDNALGRALAELQELHNETQTKVVSVQDKAPVMEENDEMLSKMTVRVKGNDVNNRSAGLAIAMTVAFILFASAFIGVVFSAIS